ncbi:MFS transporter [Carnimonas nigrificans]|uniref:MFS transporter n=1 Tax=Carnimonas nigrificans TaxID=64323 RepID=UPI0004722B80|nr:MFS transporter [Carnimonas nigrificans]
MPISLWALAIGAFGIGLTEFIVPGILPNISHTFGISIASAGSVATAYALGVFVGAPVVAICALALRLPRKTVLLLGAGIFTLGNLITGLAPNLGVTLLGRVITALNHGAFFGVGSMVAAALVAPHMKARAIAFMFGGMAMANVAGVPITTWLSQLMGWQNVYLLIAFIGLITLLGVFKLIPDMKQSTGDEHLGRELKAFIDPQVLLAMGITILGPGAFFTCITYIAPMATHLAHYSAHSIAFLMLLFGIGIFVGNIMGGRYADKSLFATLFVTLFLQSVSLFTLWMFVESKAVVAIGVVLMAGFGFATVSPIQKLVMERAQAAGGGSLAASVNIGMFNLGNALGAWIGGLTISMGIGLASPALAGAIISLLALLLAIWAYKTERKA